MNEREEEARAANRRGSALADDHRYAEAIEHYERSIAIAPERYAGYANLGIATKHVRDWKKCLASCLRALELDAERAGTGTHWNAAIAATALGDWPRARAEWVRAGVRIPPGEGPIDMDIGPTPIRVGIVRQEVVWCHRIDPARARITSVPTPECGRRYGDLVLHDGEPKGTRKLGGEDVSVFDELDVLERSPYRTWRIDVTAPSSADVDALREAFAGHDGALEDFTASLRLLCKACSEGTPHDDHDEPDGAPWSRTRRVAVAAKTSRFFGRFEAWIRGGEGRLASTPVASDS